MPTRKSSPRNRALKPSAEGLEDRRLLTGSVSGVDIDGDTWTLRLIGPGSIGVTKQNGADLSTPSEIDTITIGGTNPLSSRLIGTVHKGANGDGKVFFQNLVELPNHSDNRGGNGPLAISIPGFWLGNTTPAGSSTTAPSAPSISVPDGVATLQFGGVDTTHNLPSTPTSTTTNTQTDITLGAPQFGGTRILVDKVISSAQTALSPTGSQTATTTFQNAVVFAVSGRIDLFQANEIDGNSSVPPGQFANTVSNATGFGGTWVVSGTTGTTSFLNTGGLAGTLTGSIGNFRVGGNATNLSVQAIDGTGTGSSRISNFSIGGETSNILAISPNGSRNFYFGRGMDQVQIYTHVINNIQANRGAINSTVVADTTISRLQLGGDVQNSTFLSGYSQNYLTIEGDVTGQSSLSTFSTTPQPVPAPLPTGAQAGGGMTVLVAGDVTNSVFAASVQPVGQDNNNNLIFGDGQLALPLGRINAKIEGTVNNSAIVNGSPTQAVFAKEVKVAKGPVTPPNVPQEPYVGPERPVQLAGVRNRGHVLKNRNS